MSWSTAQVARMAKVTSRTLRHYDEIGLLPPARTGGNGYRYYEQEQLLRLQRILLLRELGLGLDKVAEIVDAGHDQVEALRQHHKWLLAEQKRYARLAKTVSDTITRLEGGRTVKPEELFEGFDLDSDRQLGYEADLRARYGEGIQASIDESKQRMRGWSADQGADFRRKWLETITRLGEVFDAGLPVDDERTQDAIHAHYQWILLSWTPNRESYTGLGQLYVDSEEFRTQIDDGHPGLAEYLRDAMAVYARQRL